MWSAVNKTKDQISDLFHSHHQEYGKSKRLTEVSELVNEARDEVRDEALTEASARNADFKRVYESQRNFEESYRAWKDKAYPPLNR